MSSVPEALGAVVGLTATPLADHGLLVKALAVDPLVCGLLELARALSAAEWEALARCKFKDDGGNAGCRSRGDAAAGVRPGTSINGRPKVRLRANCF